MNVWEKRLQQQMARRISRHRRKGRRVLNQVIALFRRYGFRLHSLDTPFNQDVIAFTGKNNGTYVTTHLTGFDMVNTALRSAGVKEALRRNWRVESQACDHQS